MVFKHSAMDYEIICDNLTEKIKCSITCIKTLMFSNFFFSIRLDSFVLAETFKYLYLLFSEEKDLVVPVNEYIFTTEAHLLPLALSLVNASTLETKVRKLYKYDTLIVMWDIAPSFRPCTSYHYISCNKIERIDFVCVTI